MKELYFVAAAAVSVLGGLVGMDWVATRRAKKRPTVEEALRAVPGTSKDDVLKILKVLEHPSQGFSRTMPAYGPFLDIDPAQYGSDNKSYLCTRHCCTIRAAQRLLKDGTFFKL